MQNNFKRVMIAVHDLKAPSKNKMLVFERQTVK